MRVPQFHLALKFWDIPFQERESQEVHGDDISCSVKELVPGIGGLFWPNSEVTANG